MAVITCAAVVWMVSFGPRFGSLYAQDVRSQPGVSYSAAAHPGQQADSGRAAPPSAG
jgi:hypothetical protein